MFSAEWYVYCIQDISVLHSVPQCTTIMYRQTARSAHVHTSLVYAGRTTRCSDDWISACVHLPEPSDYSILVGADRAITTSTLSPSERHEPCCYHRQLMNHFPLIDWLLQYNSTQWPTIWTMLAPISSPPVATPAISARAGWKDEENGPHTDRNWLQNTGHQTPPDSMDILINNACKRCNFAFIL